MEAKYAKYKLRLKRLRKLRKLNDTWTPEEKDLEKKIKGIKQKMRETKSWLIISKSPSLKVTAISDGHVDKKRIKKKRKSEEKFDENSRLERVFDALDITTASDRPEIMEEDNNIGNEYKAADSLTFSALNLSEKTMAGLKNLHFETLTPIQARAIPPALEGRDVMACAKTGSGKTLAFLIPAMELMHSLNYRPCMGTGVIIITPTKELALQIYGVLEVLSEHHQFCCALAIGGRNRSREAKQLKSGVNILVATPGRLLDHMQNTEYFFRNRVRCLILDEADRMLDIGFEDDMKIILYLLPTDRQTMFFSATLGEKTKALSKKAIKKDFVRVEVDSTPPKRLKQYVIVCDPQRRFDVLFSFLRRIMKKKSMVFMSSCKAVQYYQNVFAFAEFPVFSIHGHQKLSTRSSTFYSYREASEGTLLCTDVAARGLDIPAVDWIIQYDPPVDPTEYIHRVGRTARAGASGEALLFLRPHEIGFLSVMKQMNIETVEFDIQWSEVASVQHLLSSLVKASEVYERMAREAYESYVRSYAAYILKDHFNVDRLELTAIANSFGLKEVPLIDMKVYSSKKNRARHDFKRKLEKVKY